ncbi:MAG: hypothetical protein JWR61_1096 [Ferruginibacter sp.]|uniref:hypothetical protein n=1 Tax=Ferruginibacter sp. TaxID=1940288 RepID=UPI00265A7698|nr:hypothetical protein [Ferruginibacter sp.]MDB5276141.1 hypothetical protein [Ferruginibacter sp.]
MLAKNEIARIYDTVLSIPGMNETIKISLNIPRKNVLLLNKVIERGLATKEEKDASSNVLEMVTAENVKELLVLAADLLSKAGLTEMNQKLQAL